MITNKTLVSIATYKPLSKEEFVSLPGIGEGLYRVCGEQFIKVSKAMLIIKTALVKLKKNKKKH